MSELISGLDVVNALLDNKEVEFKSGGMDWRLLNAKQQPLEIVIDHSVLFRLKPHTVKLEIEVPAPFKPKFGEKYYHLLNATALGYGWDIWDDTEEDEKVSRFGAWRTENEIKIVVEQLSKLGALK